MVDFNADIKGREPAPQESRSHMQDFEADITHFPQDANAPHGSELT